MRTGRYLVASLLAGTAAGSSAQVMPLDQAAKAFGARESVQNTLLSPDGRSGVFTTVVSSDGEPESLDWCNFASMTRLVCNSSGRVASPGVGELVGFTRLVAIDADGANPKLPGQAGSIFDASLRQDDGDDIDWLGLKARC